MQNIIERELSNEIKTAYLDYAMSVIMQRAIPDVRDGLKPVQRRILYTMYEMGLRHNTAHKKSARVVGETLGKYHPHGDQAVYDALVRMAQDFSMRYTLIDGQGNFGSIDGDPPAAMRYTEARLKAISNELLEELKYETVSMRPNYDGSLLEPEVLPSRVPNLLMNGASGIAVGMSTNIPPHNLKELCDAIILLIDNPNASVNDIIKVLKGPDFPTGGIILGKKEIKNYFETGKGTLRLRGVAEIEELKGGKSAVVITEIPYFVKKSELIRQIAELAQSKKIEGISDIRDESNKDGMRVVVELKRDTNANVVLNNLYKKTSLEVSFGVILVAIEANRPRTFNIIQALQAFIDFRKEVTTKKLFFELREAENRLHILEGLKVVIRNIDEIINIIKKSVDVSS
ncbi:MAG: DNA gyrase subunit A, partial [bacterium]|nr:DNA gyrase subunit A [bacterium]